MEVGAGTGPPEEGGAGTSRAPQGRDPLPWPSSILHPRHSIRFASLKTSDTTATNKPDPV